MIISIFASIGSQNLGDELILKNEIKILKSKYSKLKNISENEIFFKVFTYDVKDNFYKEKNIEYLEFFPINIKKIKNIFRNIFNFYIFIKTVIKSDFIVIGGGGIIYDNENQSVGNPLKQLFFRSKIFKLFKKKVEFFRVGINIKDEKNLSIVKKIFLVANEISVRDNYSYDLLKKLGLKNIELLLDPVFFDRENLNNLSDFQATSFNTKGSKIKGSLKIEDLNVQKIKNIIEKNNLILEGKTIGIALRDFKTKDYEKNILEIIKYFLENNNKIILIPHSFHKTDKKANDYIFLKKCRDVSLKHLNNTSRDVWQKHLNKISICKNMQESYKIYTEKKIDLNLASRLHSIILSQVYEIDFIAISYSTKTDEVISLLSNQNQDI